MLPGKLSLHSDKLISCRTIKWPVKPGNVSSQRVSPYSANPGDLATMHTALDSKQENETNALQQPCWPSNNKVGGVGNAEVQSTEFKLRNLWVGLQMQGTFIICKGEYAK